ncbi:hypothetical protein EU545_04405 [Candidatus Thorarchaeota archaeon]|nr:MAG: hypothetical protein EU545_04405 [Candidatus Thorarchaeota archaeon]
MKLERSICCRELKKLDVLDSSEHKIGKINDMTFTFDGDLRLSQFILGGSAWEEFMESVGVKSDKDPVFDASLIEKMDEEVYLNTAKNSLKTTLDDCAITDEEFRLSDLEKKDILDKDGFKLGKAVDVDFEVDGSASVIVGGGFVEELLEKFGMKRDVDVIVPGDTIESIGDVVKLTVSKKELELNMDEAVKKPEQKEAKRHKTVTQDVAKVRLFSQRPF